MPSFKPRELPARWFTMNPKTFKPWSSTYKCVVRPRVGLGF